MTTGGSAVVAIAHFLSSSGTGIQEHVEGLLQFVVATKADPT